MRYMTQTAMAFVLGLGLTNAAWAQDAATTAEEVGAEPIGTAETGVDEPVDATEGDAMLAGEAAPVEDVAGGTTVAEVGAEPLGSAETGVDEPVVATEDGGLLAGSMAGSDAAVLQRMAIELFAAGFRAGYTEGAAYARAQADAMANAEAERQAQADMARQQEMRRQVQANLERRARQQRMASGQTADGFDAEMMNEQIVGGSDEALVRLLLGANALGSDFPPTIANDAGGSGDGNIVLILPRGEGGQMLMQQLMQGRQGG